MVQNCKVGPAVWLEIAIRVWKLAQSNPVDFTFGWRAACRPRPFSIGRLSLRGGRVRGGRAIGVEAIRLAVAMGRRVTQTPLRIFCMDHH